MKYLSFLILIVSACSSTKSYYDPSGKEIFMTKCPGTYNDYSLCFNRAHKKCDGKGYVIKSKTTVQCQQDLRDKPMFGQNERCNQLTYHCK